VQDYACANGVILGGIDLSANCPLGTATTTIPEQLSNANFGTTFNVLTPGYTGSVNWTIQSVTAVDVGCVLKPANFSVTAGTGTGMLRIGSWPLNYPSCPNGFTLVFTATRSNNAAERANCTVAVSVTQVAKPPTIADCGLRSVAERSIAGTNVGLPFAATNLNGAYLAQF
jgi:hypothetical protein